MGDLMLRGRKGLRAFEPLQVKEFGTPATQSYLESFAKLEATIPARWRHSQRMLESTRMINSLVFTSSGC